MIEYNTATDISSESILVLQAFENDFKGLLSNICKEDKYSNLSAKASLRLDKGKKSEKSYKLVCNPSFTIEKSYNFVSLIEEYLKKKEPEFNACLKSDQQLTIDLALSKKEKSNQYGITDNKDLPYFCPISPRFTFDQMILPKRVKDQITDALNVIKYQDLIYKDWGFETVDSIPKSVLNFYGPPGTGKTMCAHAVANEMGKKLLALNYAEIESKYVGEAPKNLQRAFEIAKDEDCVLFFDEADSFLGKRISNVTQGAEQALNSLRSQMLILLEEHSGIIIFATNLVTNFDNAFESRILKHIKFELPNTKARMAIINKMIPDKLPMLSPLQPSEVKKLSIMADGFSGREIKNSILDTLLSKVTIDKEATKFSFDDFKKSFLSKKKELQDLKDEKVADKKKKIISALKKRYDGDDSSEKKDNSSKNKKRKKDSHKQVDRKNLHEKRDNINIK